MNFFDTMVYLQHAQHSLYDYSIKWTSVKGNIVCITYYWYTRAKSHVVLDDFNRVELRIELPFPWPTTLPPIIRNFRFSFCFGEVLHFFIIGLALFRLRLILGIRSTKKSFYFSLTLKVANSWSKKVTNREHTRQFIDQTGMSSRQETSFCTAICAFKIDD